MVHRLLGLFGFLGGFCAAAALWATALQLAVYRWHVSTSDPQDLGAFFALMAALQLGLTLIAAVGAALLPDGGRSVRARVVAHLTGGAPTAWALVWAVATSLAMAAPSAWVHDAILASGATQGDVIDPISHALAGPAAARGSLALVVVLVGPLCEELVVRGYLWTVIARYLSAGWALVLTAALFGAGHWNYPAQAANAAVAGLVLGWFRWRTRSVWPGVALHVVQNALSLGSVAWADVEPMPGWAGAVGAALTLAGCAAVTRANQQAAR